MLIEPYYKNFLNLSPEDEIRVAPALLTFLDLYHFPLRGREQADFMAERIKYFKRAPQLGVLEGKIKVSKNFDKPLPAEVLADFEQ